MKVDIAPAVGRLVFSFASEEGDGTRPGLKARMGRNQCEVRLPETWAVDQLHPDLLALSVLLLAFPFVARRLEMPRAVTAGFADAVSQWTQLEITPVDTALEPRAIPTNGFPGLAFSGGMDSTAALLVLPTSTRVFFLDRILPKNRDTLYAPEAARHACHSLRSLGRRVHMIETDLETLRDPIGFPVEGATAVPLLLLADQERIDSAAFGTVMESAYRIGHDVFLDFTQRGFYRRWSSIFQAAGLPLCLPVAGLSEVATSSIVLGSPLRSVAQSCVRGGVSTPCLRCYKCFRKTILEASLEGSTLADETIDDLLSSSEVQNVILKYPVKHGNVLAFALDGYKGQHPVLTVLREHLLRDLSHTEWMRHWYQPAACLIPDTYQEDVARRIRDLVGVMDARGEETAHNWRVREIDVRARASQHEIRRALESRGLMARRSHRVFSRLACRARRTQAWSWLRSQTGGADGWLESALRKLLHRLIPSQRR